MESRVICSSYALGVGSFGQELKHSVWCVLLMIPKPLRVEHIVGPASTRRERGFAIEKNVHDSLAM